MILPSPHGKQIDLQRNINICLHISEALNPTATNIPMFHWFSRLPVELRIQIWREALPRKDEPALFFFRKECSTLEPDSETDESNYPENSHLEFIFHEELLDPIQVDVPLAFVNREARGVALPWIHEQGIKLRFCEGRLHPVHARPFDARRDVVYINDSKDIAYPIERRLEEDVLDINVSCDFHPLHIALPETVLLTEIHCLLELLESYEVIVLYIIVDSPDDLHLDSHAKVQRLWQVKDSNGHLLQWDYEHGRFNVRAGDNTGENSVSKHIDQINQLLSATLSQGHARPFDIRPVYAIRK